MSFVSAISFHFPSDSSTNEEIIEEYKKYCPPEEYMEVTPEDIVKQCGIRRRYSSHPEDTAKDLGLRAAENLFKEHGVERSEIEYLIFVSDALDYKGPTTACVMQENLGLSTQIGAIDILHGCTGWVYGLSLANALIESGQVNNVLLITADVPTKVVHPKDIVLRAIFSDAAAATFIRKSPDNQHGISGETKQFVFGTDGKGEQNLMVERSATKAPADIEWLSQFTDVPKGMTGGRLIMDSPKIFLFAIRHVPKLVDQVLAKNQTEKEAIDYFILHQANGVMIEFIRKKMKIPKEKFIINLEPIGNTVSASIPIALAELLDQGKIKKGHKVLVAGFGIGYSWGGCILQF